MSQFGLLGKNIAKSLSKFIHEKVLNEQYDLIQISSDEEFLSYLKTDFELVNVTNPYKALAFEQCTDVDDVAKATKVVNTIIKIDGELYGYNTDALGFFSLLRKSHINVLDKKCLILGTGSTSKTVEYVLNEFGANSVYFLSRNKTGDNIRSYDNIKDVKDAQIIINTTPVGAFSNGDDEPLISNVDQFNKVEAYIDINYSPITTNQSWLFKRKGIKTINGLYMLIMQAIMADELYLQEQIDEEVLEEICKEISAKYSNLVIIGHPLSGKTSVGKQLAEKLEMKHFDVDEEIEKLGMSIPEIFSQKGENYFRKLESEIIEKLASEQGCVISTGGGAVLDESNIKKLSVNGHIISLNRRLENIDESSIQNRPLIRCKKDLEKLILERENLYKKYADIFIENSTVKETVERIEKSLWI